MVIVNLIKEELAMMNSQSTVYLQECLVIIEAKKKRILYSL